MDHKLKTFRVVAQTQSFSKASKILNISQPAVSKSIKSLEEEYEKALFERKANSIELTENGKIVLKYANHILQLYEELEDEFFDNNSLFKKIKLGASTTIANYIMPRLLASIQNKFPELRIELIVGNTLDIQQAVLKKEVNLGFVEGDNHNTRLKYEKFVKDELVLVSKYNLEEPEEITLEDLINLPIVGRELGSGTREVIENSLAKHKIDITQYSAVLGSTESIKNYLLHKAQSYSFLSMHSMDMELGGGKLRIIDVKGIEINRWFYSITRQGFQSKLSTKIKNLLSYAYNQRE